MLMNVMAEMVEMTLVEGKEWMEGWWNDGRSVNVLVKISNVS